MESENKLRIRNIGVGSAGKSLVKKYCAHCKQKIADSSKPFCEVCGLPAEPISIYEKLECDTRLNNKDKTALSYAAKISLICVAIEIIVMLFAVGIAWAQYSVNVEQVEYAQAAQSSAKQEYNEFDIYKGYPSVEEMKQFKDYDEYLMYLHDRGLVYNPETAKIALNYWNTVGIMESFSNGSENPFLQLEKQREKNIPLLRTTAVVTTVIGSLVILFEVYCAAVSIAFLRKKEWCLRQYNEAFYSNAYVCLFTGNFISCLLMIHANNTIVRLIQKMDSGEGYYAPMDKRIKALRGENDGEWECNCGYFNLRGVSECRSCGKYR